MCDHDDGFDGLDWQDLALIGSLTEFLAEERKECEQIRKEVEQEQEKDEEDIDDPLK
jgi:hypothetical protein